MTSHHYPRKRFGQHFLADLSVLEQIQMAINPRATDCMVEIGPGLGALTEHLLCSLNHLYAIEIDRDLIRSLQARYHPRYLTLYLEDVLKFDFNEIKINPMRLVGNLPYNIATTLLFYLFHFIDKIDDMHFMLQKEVANRLTAPVGDSNYGRLTVMVRYFCDCQKLFDIPPQAFYPQPKVHSSLVRLLPKRQKTPVDFLLFDRLVRNCFNQRRKTLGNAIKTLINPKELKSLSIDSHTRAQQISIENFIRIAQHLRLSEGAEN